jgi:hypothetical protein
MTYSAAVLLRRCRLLGLTKAIYSTEPSTFTASDKCNVHMHTVSAFTDNFKLSRHKSGNLCAAALYTTTCSTVVTIST